MESELKLKWEGHLIAYIHFLSIQMKERYKNKYRTESIRLREYDYRTSGWYFVTICTINRKCFFGEIRNGIVGLRQEGITAYLNWEKIPQHFSQVILDEFIIMPNHMHGLLGLDIKPYDHHLFGRDVEFNVSTKGTNRHSMSEISPKSGSLSSIIRTYKGSVTRDCNKSGLEGFSWQSRFYEHVVRNEESLNRIREYIYYNPLRWDEDDYYIPKKSLSK